MSNIKKYSEKTFEEIKHINEFGSEYWLARDLALVLEYSQWRNFFSVIEKAMGACANSGFTVDDHFADVSKMVDIGSNTQREIEDIELSRYACYLIVQNADPRKKVVALGQTYFAVQQGDRSYRMTLINWMRTQSAWLFGRKSVDTINPWLKPHRWRELKLHESMQFFKTKAIRAFMEIWALKKYIEEKA